MLYKNVSDSSTKGVITDVDTKTGTVTGYFSIFGNVDSDGDMIMPGAFKASLKNNYHRQKHLDQHNPTRVLSGTKKGNLIVREDSIGLYFESKIAPTTIGKDVLISYERGDLDEHSIGYEVVKQQKASGYNELLELKLWEGSTVTWGANERANTTGLKSMKAHEAAKVQMADVLYAIKNGTIEAEEVSDVLELTFKQLEQYIIDLSASSSQPVVETVDPQKRVKNDDLNVDEILGFIHLKQSLITTNLKGQNETQLQRMALS